MVGWIIGTLLTAFAPSSRFAFYSFLLLCECLLALGLMWWRFGTSKMIGLPDDSREVEERRRELEALTLSAQTDAAGVTPGFSRAWDAATPSTPPPNIWACLSELRRKGSHSQSSRTQLAAVATPELLSFDWNFGAAGPWCKPGGVGGGSSDKQCDVCWPFGDEGRCSAASRDTAGSELRRAWGSSDGIANEYTARHLGGCSSYLADSGPTSGATVHRSHESRLVPNFGRLDIPAGVCE